MGEVIAMPGDAHQQVSALLSWYAAGTLDARDAATVEAHLLGCAVCREDLLFDRAVGGLSTDAPLDVERGWAATRDRLTRTSEGSTDTSPTSAPKRRRWLERQVPLVWALVAQAAAVVLFVGASRIGAPVAPVPLYHGLGSSPRTAPGNIVAIFRPNTIERDLRDAVLTSGAELVGGPTASHAYILRVAAPQRADALARLQANSHVVMAEPIDADLGR